MLAQPSVKEGSLREQESYMRRPRICSRPWRHTARQEPIAGQLNWPGAPTQLRSVVSVCTVCVKIILLSTGGDAGRRMGCLLVW